MIYFLLALARNCFLLLWRLAIWPLWLHLRRRPLTLRVDLPGTPPRRPPGRLMRWLGRTEMDLETLHGTLDVVRRDPLFRGLLVTVPRLGMGRSDLADLREALGRVVRAGKRVTVVLREGGGMRELRLAPEGARVVLHPSAILRIEGLAAMPVFLGEFLERIGVRADLEAVGEYKTAPEMFTRAEPTERNLEQVRGLLEDLDRGLLEDVARGRGREREVVRGWMQRQVFPASEAVEAGIVDASAFDDEVESELEVDTRVVRPRTLAARARLGWRFVPLRRPLLVGVIGVRGQILMRGGGVQGSGAAIASRIVPLIDRAGRDPAIRAIVLDVDSRGGSAMASDAIYRQARTSAGLKPVLAYLGDVAASGGYYVASAAHEIVASHDAITGSIGVFGGKVASDGALERLGIRTRRITLGDQGAGMMLPDRPFTDEEREVVRREMQAIYDTFLHVVALRKGREVEEVEVVAGGRVFSARRALENDLVDRLGTRADLLDALATRLKCRADRIRLVHLGREGPLEGVELPHATGSVAVEVAQTTRLIARDRIAAELPFYMIMGSP